MTGGALHLAIAVQAHVIGQRGRLIETAIGRSQSGIIGEGGGMMRREVRAEITGAGRHGRDRILHRDGRKWVVDLAEGYGAVMTTQAQLGGT